MVSITLGIPDFKFDGTRTYEELKKEMIEAEAAKHNKAKTSADDLSIGHEIGESVPSSQQSISNPPHPPAPAPAAAAPAEGGASAPAAGAPDGFIPPELDAAIVGNAAQTSASSAMPAVVQ
jgi:hypothetical protein